MYSESRQRPYFFLALLSSVANSQTALPPAPGRLTRSVEWTESKKISNRLRGGGQASWDWQRQDFLFRFARLPVE